MMRIIRRFNNCFIKATLKESYSKLLESKIRFYMRTLLMKKENYCNLNNFKDKT